MRLSYGIRRPISSKSKSYTEGMVVDAAGISVKVYVHYPGRPANLSYRTTLAVMLMEELAGVSRGHSRRDYAKGPNMLNGRN